MNTGHRNGNDSERSDVSLVVVRPAKEMSTLLAVDRPEAVNDIETPRVKELESRGGRSS